MDQTNHLFKWPGISFYEAELGIQRIAHPPAKGAKQHRILVIGAGLAGLSTAWSLVERGITDIAICDAHQPGHGASGRNGGFVFAGYSLPNQALVKQVGQAAGQKLHQWTRQAVGLVRHRIAQLDIDCHANDAGVLLADWFGDDQSLKAFQQQMGKDLGFQLDWVDRSACRQLIASKRYGAALHEPGSFHFQPLRYIDGLIRALQQAGVTIYGDSPVQTLEKKSGSTTNRSQQWEVTTQQAVLSAEEVVLTTGGYDTGVWPKISRAIQPIATYIATTAPLGDSIHQLLSGQHAVYDTRFAFDYYRPLPDTRLLWGGRISIRALSPMAIKKALKKDLGRVFPELGEVELDHAWGGWMGYTRHQMPLLGKDPQGLWHATGFGGHGMAPTTLAGEVVAEAMIGDTERLEAFLHWQPVWAGSGLGRAVAQATYWWLNTKDRWRDRRPNRHANRHPNRRDLVG